MQNQTQSRPLTVGLTVLSALGVWCRTRRTSRRSAAPACSRVRASPDFGLTCCPRGHDRDRSVRRRLQSHLADHLRLVHDQRLDRTPYASNSHPRSCWQRGIPVQPAVLRADEPCSLGRRNPEPPRVLRREPRGLATCYIEALPSGAARSPAICFTPAPSSGSTHCSAVAPPRPCTRRRLDGSFPCSPARPKWSMHWEPSTYSWAARTNAITPLPFARCRRARNR